jgi:uncharacterized membrane protein (DUF485 family)
MQDSLHFKNRVTKHLFQRTQSEVMTTSIMQLLVLYYETLILISFTLHFMQVQPVFSNHLSYFTPFSISVT